MIENEEIDIVLTYVNGLDAKHIKKRNKFLNNLTNKYNPSVRFESVDEIKYFCWC